MSTPEADVLSGADAAAIRERLGLSVDALAAELALTPDVVAAWESGRIAVPKRIAGELRWRDALAERVAALAASGLEECKWMAAWEAEKLPDGMSARAKHFEKAINHQPKCETCLARQRYLEARFGPMPARPLPGIVGIMGWLRVRIEKLPRWLQPPAWGALMFVAFSLVRIAFGAAGYGRDLDEWLNAIIALAINMVLGAALGLVYSGQRAVQERMRRK